MMKKILSAVIFCCAMTTAVNAQNAVKDLLKSAEKKAKLADKNPKNGKMQYQAAMAFIDDALGEEKIMTAPKPMPTALIILPKSIPYYKTP